MSGDSVSGSGRVVGVTSTVITRCSNSVVLGSLHAHATPVFHNDRTSWPRHKPHQALNSHGSRHKLKKLPTVIHTIIFTVTATVGLYFLG